MKRNSLTLIELIMTIVLLAIIMIPVGLVITEYLKGVVQSRNLVLAEGLIKTEMAKVNNLAYDNLTLADGYDNNVTNYEGYDLDLRREVNYVAGSNNLLKQVSVTAYKAGTATRLDKVITYIANVSFGSGSGGGAAGGGEADSLIVSGGSISGEDLQNVTLENSGVDDITITGVTISFTGAGGIKFKTITLGGSQRWSGTENSGSTVTLDTSFTLSAGTTYTNTGQFGFSKNLSSVSSLVFIMGDATETPAYSW